MLHRKNESRQGESFSISIIGYAHRGQRKQDGGGEDNLQSGRSGSGFWDSNF